MPVYNELFFLGFICDNVKGPWLPTNGNMLRCYFERRQTHPKETPRAAAGHVVGKCVKIWKKRGIPTTQESNGIKYLLKMLKDFKRMRGKYAGYTATQQRETLALWEQRYELLFSVGTKDALEQCQDEATRAFLRDAKKRRQQFKKGAPIEPNEPAEKRTKPGPKCSKLPKAKSAEAAPKPKSPEKPKADAPTIVTASAIFRQDFPEDAAATRPSIIKHSSANKTVWVGEFGQTFPVGIVKAEPVAEEPIAPPPVQSSVVKDEVNIDWNPSDNWSTELLFRAEEPVVSPTTVQVSIVKEDVDLEWDQTDNCSTQLLFVDKVKQSPFGLPNKFSCGALKY